MGTTADKLNRIIRTKADIKTAIEAKGVTVGDIPFSEYPARIARITAGGERHGETPILDCLGRKLEEALAQYAADGYDCGIASAWVAGDDVMRPYRGANGHSAQSNTSRIIFNDGYTQIGQNLSRYYDEVNIQRSGYPITSTVDMGDGVQRCWKISLYTQVNAITSNSAPVDHLLDLPAMINDSATTLMLPPVTHIVCKNTVGWSTNADLPALRQIRVIAPSSFVRFTTGSVRSSRLSYIDGFDCVGYTNFPIPAEITTFKNIKNIGANVNFNLYNGAVTLDSLRNLIEALVDDGTTHTFQLQGYGQNLRRLQRFAPEYIQIANDKGWTLT